MRRIRASALALVVALSILLTAKPQVWAATTVAPAESSSIDQTRYFATREIEQAEFKQRLEEVANFPVAVPDGARALEDYLRRAETLLAQLERHGAYLHLRASRDIDDRADADASDQVDEAVDQVIASVAITLCATGPAAFAKQVAVSPALGRYAYLLDKAEREVAHELPKDQQAILREIADPALANLWTLYEQTVRSTPFAKIPTADGELDVKKNALLLALNSDRAIRQAAWQGRLAGYASRAEIYATLLLGVVRLEDRVARLRHFPDAPSMVYFSRNLDRRDVTDALQSIATHADEFKNYQQLRAQHISRMTGIADVHSWDLSLPAPGFVAPRFTLEQTRHNAVLALAPLGPDYVEHFRQLLDPANRRVDVDTVQGKRTNGGFSISAPGVSSGLFVENYGAGLLNNSRVILHEGGHAIHKQLMMEAEVSPFYVMGPNWMFEAFATLNQFLLYDHLYKTAKAPEEQAYYLEALLYDMTFQLFGSAEEGTLEQSIYDGVIDGRIKNAAELDALCLSIWEKYEIWPALEPELAHTWMTKGLLVQDPLYLVNYLYAGLLATKMFDMSERDPAGFQKRYTELLRHGFYAPPQELLRTFFGRDMPQQQLVADGMNILQQRIAALAAIYKTLEAKHGRSAVAVR